MKLKRWIILLFIVGLLLMITATCVIILVGIQSGGMIVVMGIIFLTSSVLLFSKWIPYYPLNSIEDYKYDAKKSIFKDKNNEDIIIFAKEVKKGLWLVSDNKNTLIFDMKKFFFPKLYICSFFIRHLHYGIINKKKLMLAMMGGNIKLGDKFSKTAFIEFHYGNNIKKMQIIKKNKTKTLGMKQWLILANYRQIGIYSNMPKTEQRACNYTVVSEKILYDENRKINLKKTMSYKKKYDICDTDMFQDCLIKIEQLEELNGELNIVK